MFCWSFLLIAILGPGAWSLHRLIKRSRKVTNAELVEA
jgi:uncharacterized membrane protein YphA (DoxX/SURF4 family)